MNKLKKSKSNKLTFNLPIVAMAVSVISIGLVFGLPSVTDASGSRSSHRQVCSDVTGANASCLVRVVTNRAGAPAVVATPIGLSPTQIHKAYNLPNISTNPATIAVVTAYDHPYIKGDLDTYNRTYGLPTFPTCSRTVTKACFTKVSQSGSTSRFPAVNAGWALETSLDVETVHQVCQNCKLVLVEANSNSYNDLMAAVDQARLQGATVISNSYGSAEFAGEATFDSHFNYPGIAFVFSSGDSGYGATYPASSKYVTAVGGTSLYLNADNTRSAEVVWSGAGSGCSTYESKPAFQLDAGCATRTVADVSAVADPNTGAAIYDSVAYLNQRGWFQLGGTSLAAPIIAGIYGLAGNTSTMPAVNAALYSAPAGSLYDVVSGSNGSCPTPYLCTGTIGYDGPTGIGSPNGIAAF